MLKEERQQQEIQTGIKRAQSSSSMGSNALTGSQKTGLSASDAQSANTSNNGDDNDGAHAEDENDEMKDQSDQTGNGDIIKTINEIFKEVSDQIMDDAYTRLKYIKKLNPTNKGK